jgi:hypothetical protein
MAHAANSLSSAETDFLSAHPEETLATHRYHHESASSLDEKGRTHTGTPGAKIKVYKKTIGLIFGLYLIGTSKVEPIEITFAYAAAALLCSISHHIFFARLHGTKSNGEDASISQSHATVISLLLVTLFKASLLGCVGVCSVQYLWRVLRGQSIAVSTIESLFQMRHNPLELFYCRTLLSVSFLLAAYTWIVPLATIYPPGALTINSTPFELTESMQMSMPELVFDSKFDPLQPEDVSRLGRFAGVWHFNREAYKNETSTGTVNMSTGLQIMGPQASLIRFSKSVIAAGEIMSKPPATLGENSTYILEFMGPQLSCRIVEQSNRTVTNTSFADLVIGEADHSPPKAGVFRASAMGMAYVDDEVYKWQIIQQNMLGGTPCQDSQGNLQTLDENGARDYKDGIVLGAPPNGTYSERYLIETSKMSCSERYVEYIANVTYSKGVRSVQYSMRDIKPQPVKELSISMHWEAPGAIVDPGRDMLKNASLDAAFAASPYFQMSKNYLKEKFRYWNAFAIYTAFLDTIDSATDRYCFFVTTAPTGSTGPSSGGANRPKCNAEWTRPNGSHVAFGPVTCPQQDRCKYIETRLPRRILRAKVG